MRFLPMFILALSSIEGCQSVASDAGSAAAKASQQAPLSVSHDPRAIQGTGGVQLDPGDQNRSQQGTLGPGCPDFWVRPGFRVDLVADNLGEGRFMTFDDKGLLYLSKPGEGKIITLKWNGSRYEKLADFVTKHPSVHGMQFYKGWLWFTESGAIFRAKCEPDGIAKEVVTVIPNGQLPKGGHFWRSILVDDRGFYTSIGDSGNINEDADTLRQRIWRYSLDGKQKQLFCWGIRNTEKLRYQPGTTSVWGFDHGSDWYGKLYGDQEGRQPITDDMPPEQLHHYVQGGFYGHPYFVWAKVPRAEYAGRKDLVQLAEKMVLPEYSFGAHWAPNGWTFYTGTGFPKDYVGDIFIAFHGSWNRSQRAGYRVEHVFFDKLTGRPFGSQQVMGTLRQNGEVLARPVDVEQTPDGALVVSDDLKGRIFRISWIGDR